VRQLIHAEWTKFRTVRGWVIGMVVAVPLTVLVGLLGPLGSNFACAGPNGQSCANQTVPTGPDGTPVNDSFTFVNRTLTGDGVITARVRALRDAEPWAKAGLIVKKNTTVGSQYAAVLRTGAHGVRMQHNFTEDIAGPRDATWLRLTRKGNTLTGATSPDGEHWTTISTVSVDLGTEVVAGMFVSSPEHVETSRSFGSIDQNGGPTTTTTTFDDVTTDGDWSSGWRQTDIGGTPEVHTGYTENAGVFSITGHGDITPIVSEPGSRGRTVENTLVGGFTGLIAVLVVATMFVTGEHRRGLIRTSLAAHPRRGQLLAAKAIVMGSVSFVVGLVAAALTVPIVRSVEVAKGFYLYPASAFAVVRVIVGTGLLFGVAAVLAVAIGMVLRRGAGTVTAMIVGLVLPYLLAVASVMPQGPSEWLTAITPAAAFAIQQTIHEFPQVSASYAPADGYFPLSPAAGFAVLCLYAAVAMVFATVALRRRDV